MELEISKEKFAKNLLSDGVTAMNGGIPVKKKKSVIIKEFIRKLKIALGIVKTKEDTIWN